MEYGRGIEETPRSSLVVVHSCCSFTMPLGFGRTEIEGMPTTLLPLCITHAHNRTHAYTQCRNKNDVPIRFRRGGRIVVVPFVNVTIQKDCKPVMLEVYYCFLIDSSYSSSSDHEWCRFAFSWSWPKIKLALLLAQWMQSSLPLSKITPFSLSFLLLPILYQLSTFLATNIEFPALVAERNVGYIQYKPSGLIYK